jgi:HEPN domain-containing protein
MMQTTAEWVSKAEGDYDAASILRRSRKPSRFDAVCFHSQQCVEKYLKARLNEAGVRFGKVHDLALLLKSTVNIEPLWTPFEQEFKELTDFAVAVRYPGTFTDALAAREAFATCRRFRALARMSLGLRT